jgi:hypothetical protein
LSLVIVTIAGNSALVLFAGLASGLHGVYQLNVQPAPYSGNQIQVGAGSFTSTALTLPIPVGTNATNVKGLVEQWYPGSGTQLGGQFPGGIIPQSRIDPTASSAIRSPATLALRNGGGRFHARNLFAQGQ